MKKLKTYFKKINVLIGTSWLGLTAASTVKAQITNPILKGEAGSDAPGAKDGSLLYKLISGLLSFMMIVGAILVLINLIQAGIDWISSGGDSGKIESARDRLTNAVIGLIILSASYAIWLLVKQFLGVSLSIKLLIP